MRLLVAIIPLIFLLTACNEKERCQPEIAWYHWKSSLDTAAMAQAFQVLSNTGKVYLRVFDVDLEEGSGRRVPVGLFEGFPEGAVPENFIPVVFITNRSLQDFAEGKTVELAENISRLVSNYLPSPAELQLDCDWTESTRAAFFRLVEAVKNKLPNTAVSVTIRLHQFKYPEQSGVPPADQGMLMVYNMGEVDSWETENSIIQPSIAAQYLEGVRGYPLPLDVALPLFQWACVYRDGRLVQLFHNLTATELSDTTRFEPIATGRFLTKKNTFLNGFFLNKGDRIRLEEVAAEDLKAVAEMLRPIVDCCQSTLAFYHLDSTILEKYSPEQLQEVVDELCE